MTEVIRLKKRLEKFGLNSKQVDIYVLLLRQGNMRISEISRALHIPRSSVYEVLKGLLDRGLAEEIIENSFKVIQAYSIGVLQHNFDEQYYELKRRSEDLVQLEKALETLPAMQSRPPITIRYYKDRAGARQLFWNTLNAKGMIYVQSEWGRGRYVGIEFYKRFVAESYARNIKEQVITNSSPRVLESIREHAGTPVSRSNLDTIRCLDEDVVKFRGDTLMYDNIYAHIDLKNDHISGFEIESQQFTDTQRAIFKSLWEAAEPIRPLL